MELAGIFIVRVSDSVCVNVTFPGSGDSSLVAALLGRKPDAVWMDRSHQVLAWLVSSEEVTSSVVPHYREENAGLLRELTPYLSGGFALTLYVPSEREAVTVV